MKSREDTAAEQVAALLEAHGYKRCQPPPEFRPSVGAPVHFMESREGRITKVSPEGAVDYLSRRRIDLQTGKLMPLPSMQPGFRP